MVMQEEEDMCVNLLFSGLGYETGRYNISMYHVYAACIPPLALGIESRKVMLYCPSSLFMSKALPTLYEAKFRQENIS